MRRSKGFKQKEREQKDVVNLAAKVESGVVGQNQTAGLNYPAASKKGHRPEDYYLANGRVLWEDKQDLAERILRVNNHNLIQSTGKYICTFLATLLVTV